MKYLSTGIIVIAIIAIVHSSASAVGGNNPGAQPAAQPSKSPVAQVSPRPSPTGNQVQNTNQVRTQNMGEEKQLQVNTAEQEQLKSGSERSEVAQAKMSQVAKAVEEVLSLQGAKGGIGDQIRTIAQEQKTTQTTLQTQLKQMDKRGTLAKFVLGPDQQAIKNLERELAQNQLRIEELNKLQTQLENEADIIKVQAMIQSMTDQNVALRERLNAESQTRSLFGWLFRLFNK